MEAGVLTAEECKRREENARKARELAVRLYPNEKWIKETMELQITNEFTKNLVMPENVWIAASRVPENKNGSEILQKELRQAKILTDLGNAVCFTPEPGSYKKRVTDAIVNNTQFEFRTVTGNRRQVESEFGDAKRKGAAINVFLSIESGIDRHEVRRRIGLVLKRHKNYSGKIIVTFNGGKTYFWDSEELR